MTEPPKSDLTVGNHAATAAFRAEVERMSALPHEAFHELDPRTLPQLKATISAISREMPCS